MLIPCSEMLILSAKQLLIYRAPASTASTHFTGTQMTLQNELRVKLIGPKACLLLIYGGAAR